MRRYNTNVCRMSYRRLQSSCDTGSRGSDQIGCSDTRSYGELISRARRCDKASIKTNCRTIALTSAASLDRPPIYACLQLPILLRMPCSYYFPIADLLATSFILLTLVVLLLHKRVSKHVRIRVKLLSFSLSIDWSTAYAMPPFGHFVFLLLLNVFDLP